MKETKNSKGLKKKILKKRGCGEWEIAVCVGGCPENETITKSYKSSRSVAWAVASGVYSAIRRDWNQQISLGLVDLRKRERENLLRSSFETPPRAWKSQTYFTPWLTGVSAKAHWEMKERERERKNQMSYVKLGWVTVEKRVWETEKRSDRVVVVVVIVEVNSSSREHRSEWLYY